MAIVNSRYFKGGGGGSLPPVSSPLRGLPPPPSPGAPEAAREPVSASLASMPHGERPGKCRGTESMSKGRLPPNPHKLRARRVRPETPWRAAGTLLILLVFAAFPLAAQSNFTRGEELFMQNQPAEALPFLTAASEEDPANIKAYLYLAVVYLQLDRGDDAVATYLRVLPRAGAETSQIAYNLGNIYYNRGNNETAIKYYNEAIAADPANASAYLNRANALVRSGLRKEALSDYGYYLTLEPRSAKRAQIEQLTAFINEEFAAAERQRVLEEQRRLEEEALAKAEAERKQRLLEEVSASLQAAAEETQGLSAGSEGMLDYEGEFELAE